METFDEANPIQSRMRVTIYQRTVADNDKTPLVPFAINPMPLVLNPENLQHVGLSVHEGEVIVGYDTDSRFLPTSHAKSTSVQESTSAQ